MENQRQRFGREKYSNVARKNWGHKQRFDEELREVIMKREIEIKEK